MRSLALLGSFVLLAGCARPPSVPVAPPTKPAIDLAAFTRIWVAGFVTTPHPDIDVNLETVRLVRRQLTPRTSLRIVQNPPLAIAESELFDAGNWRRLAEEYGEPLIVSGSVKLVEAPPVAVERTTVRGSSYASRKGFVLEATFVFIDGRNGEVVASERVAPQKLYGDDARASTMSLYFQLMDRVLPAFLRLFSSIPDSSGR